MAVNAFVLNPSSRGIPAQHFTCTAKTARLSATTGTTGTFQMPTVMNKLAVGVGTCPSSTFTVKAKMADVGASFRPLKADLDGNAYPRATYTGNEVVNFLVPFGAQVLVTGSGCNLTLQPWR